MSKVSALDLGVLRARLILAIEGADGLLGSPFLIALASLYLAAAPEAEAELGLWQSLVDLQAAEEQVDADDLLAVLRGVTALVGDA